MNNLKNNVPAELDDEILIFFRKDEKEAKRAIHQINLNKPCKRGYDCVAITSQFEFYGSFLLGILHLIISGNIIFNVPKGKLFKFSNLSINKN